MGLKIFKEAHNMRKNYSEEQKKEILSRYRSGETLSSICKNTGIYKSTLYQWSKSTRKNQIRTICTAILA